VGRKICSSSRPEIAVERGHVDESVRAVVHGVDVGKCAGGVRETDDFFHWIDGADCI
jgi:hypothetical protein